jgi:hypothetical protein
MDFFNPLFIQVVLDLALFLAIIILLWRVNSLFKNPDSQRQMIAELKTLIVESQASADLFVEALEKSRLALKEIALELELKEKRIKLVLEKTGGSAETGNAAMAVPEAAFSQSKYAEVINMIHSGHTEEETARVTGFTQAEVGLIVDLSRIKNENS